MGICLSWLFYRVSGTILVHILADLRSSQLITSWKFALSLTKIVPWTVPLFCFLRMLQDEHDPSLQSSPVSWYVHFVLGGSDESIVSPENINYTLSTGCFWSLYWFIEIWTFTEFSNQYLVTICTKGTGKHHLALVVLAVDRQIETNYYTTINDWFSGQVSGKCFYLI